MVRVNILVYAWIDIDPADLMSRIFSTNNENFFLFFFL
jgi:hypothetical protein